MEESQKKSVKSIQLLQKEIEADLKKALNDEGVIDEIKLEETNKPLAEIFDLITMSKTWRDDPRAYAKEVARLISARQKGNDLSNALDKLDESLKRRKK